MHLNQGSNGSTLIKELTDFPGIFVTDVHLKKQRRTKRTIEFDGVKYGSLDAAVEAWKRVNLEGGEP